MSENKIYIAGPMSGIPEYNAPEFNQAAQMWKDQEFDIFNPIESPMSRLVQEGHMSGQEAYRACLHLDLEWITTTATAIYMLKGWEKSLGAKAEHATAMALGLQIIYQ